MMLMVVMIMIIIMMIMIMIMMIIMTMMKMTTADHSSLTNLYSVRGALVGDVSSQALGNRREVGVATALPTKQQSILKLVA